VSSTRANTEYTIERLGPQHDRAAFGCGVPALDTYLQRHARQDVERRLAAVFVLTADSNAVAGFYTLSANSMLAVDLPESEARKLPRFPLPATLIGRMAVSQSLHGRGLGQFLLMQALESAWIGSRQVASWAVLVDAKANAHHFYRKNGFVSFPAQPDRLYLHMKTIDKLFHPETIAK